MKLILCTKCHDVFKLTTNETRQCKCGVCGGFYKEDGVQAEYWGDPAVPLGFANSSLVDAVRNQPEKGLGELFEAFVIPKECSSMKKVESEREEACPDP